MPKPPESYFSTGSSPIGATNNFYTWFYVDLMPEAQKQALIQQSLIKRSTALHSGLSNIIKVEEQGRLWSRLKENFPDLFNQTTELIRKKQTEYDPIIPKAHQLQLIIKKEEETCARKDKVKKQIKEDSNKFSFLRGSMITTVAAYRPLVPIPGYIDKFIGRENMMFEEVIIQLHTTQTLLAADIQSHLQEIPPITNVFEPIKTHQKMTYNIEHTRNRIPYLETLDDDQLVKDAFFTDKERFPDAHAIRAYIQNAKVEKLPELEKKRRVLEEYLPIYLYQYLEQELSTLVNTGRSIVDGENWLVKLPQIKSLLKNHRKRYEKLIAQADVLTIDILGPLNILLDECANRTIDMVETPEEKEALILLIY